VRKKTTAEKSIVQTGGAIASANLLDFFSGGGRSVLVRGDPGTGKTSLVLQLLDFHSRNGFKSVYMSTRLSAKTLKSHQPWVEVVQGKYGNVPSLEQDQIGFQDSRRMDGVRAISGLRTYLEQVSNPFVVLDSWEGLFFESHTMGVEEISKLVEDYDARFVVVTERREQTDLDYLLDGVVVLRRKFHEGRVIREIELKKLRGVSINQSRFIFTLDQGKFRFLPPVRSRSRNDSMIVGEPLPDPETNICSSGSHALDSMLGGGFRRGSLDLFEISNDVPFEVTSIFIQTILSNFVNNGHKVLFIPFLGSARTLLETALPNLSKKTIEESIMFLNYEAATRKPLDHHLLTGEAAQDFKLVDSKIEELRKLTDKAVLVVTFQDAMEGFYGAENASRQLVESLAISKSSGDIRLQIASPSSLLLPELKALSDCNFRVEMVHATPLVYSIKPLSVLHGIVADGHSKGKLGLVPIV
jgi:KaiC/GvpD/RAD55 family RecA-like ATPase